MQTLFEHSTTDEVIARIERLHADLQPQWGEMNVAQMLAHCAAFQDIAAGISGASRSWLGFFVGQLAKPVFYNDRPLPTNMSTLPEIRIADEKSFEAEKEKLIHKLRTFQANGPQGCTTRPHPFFGKLSAEQWGKGMYKHIDHHLRQFGA